jgi:pimeloyl-ACP methyl ester carboxylesterase
MCQHYRVVCPDVVGRGRSEWLRDPQYYAIPQYVADMVTLMARLKPLTLHWLGTSMGGLIGLAYAAMTETPISKLILNDVGPLLSASALTRISEYLGTQPMFDSFEAGVMAVRSISSTFGRFSDSEWRDIAAHVLIQHDGRWKFHYDPGIGAGFKQIASQGENISLWSLYDAVHCPTLAIRGVESDLLSPQTHAEMAQRGPRAQLLEFPDCGHAPMFMHESQIQAVKSFLLKE